MSPIAQDNPVFVGSSSEANAFRPIGTKEKTISLSQLTPFLDIAIPFFREDRAAFCSLVGIVVLTLVKAGLLIFFSYVRRDMFSALNHKNAVEFYEMIAKFFGVLVVFVPIAVLYHYLRLRLALYWRKELTARVLDKYYANRTYYIMECCKDIDNPDQRISEDLREFTSTSLDFFFILFKAVINLLSFSIVLYHICPLLFMAIIVYAVMGTFVAARLGRSLVGQYYNKLQTEANFRFGLIRTRENAEGIAFYDSEASMEQVNIWNLFEQVVESNLQIIYTRRNLEMFTMPYDYLVYVIPYVVLAPLYLNGSIDLGSITQGSEAFNNVRSDFSIVVDYFEKLSLFSAGIDRLSTFIRRVNEGGWPGERTSDTPTVFKPTQTSSFQYIFNFIGGIRRFALSKLGIKTKNMDFNYVQVRSHEDALYNGGESDNGANQSQKSREREKEKEKERARESASRLTLPARSSTIEFLILSSSQFESQSHSDSLADLITLQQKERHHLESLDENTTIAQMKSSSTHSSNICRTTVPVDFKKYPKKLDGSNLVSSSSTSVPVLLCENLTVFTPDGSRTLIGGIGDDHFFSNNADEETDGRKMRKYNDPSRDGGVNFEIFPGDKVLIAGTSGNGKSSLLRAISGLWELGSGRVTWNTNLDLCSLSGVGGGSSVGSDYSGNKAPQGVFFLPQKPYNLLGSLRQQIAYPSICPGDDPGVAVVAGIEIGIGIGIETGIKDQTGSSSNSNLMQSDNRSNLDKNIMFTQKNRSDSDSELLAILTIVKLGTLASRMGSGDEEVGLGVCKDWTKVLSLGEQQRLAFARVLYNRKNISVVVLDEATSALDESSEAAMYSLLSDLKVTYLSVGHRASLYKFHSRKITLNGPGREVACIPIPQTVTTVSDREREGKRDRQAD